MPINFDLEKLRKEHHCLNYFETGLWDPRSDVSSKRALSCGFEKLYCIEIRKDLVSLGLEVFKEEIRKDRYHLILDDSTNMEKYVNDDTVFRNKTMFFLDAHVDNINIENYKKRCPLFEELNAIKSINRNDNVILIDDLRLITTDCWGETSYGNINFLDKIKEQILSINTNYKFATLNGHIENDVLLAYV